MGSAKSFLRWVHNWFWRDRRGGQPEPCVVSRDQAKQLVESYAHEFEVMAFAELKELAQSFADRPDCPERIVDKEGVKISLWADIGATRGKRGEDCVIVEVFVDAPGMDRWWWRPCYYFERYSSGRTVKY